jgi:hypothetical protein
MTHCVTIDTLIAVQLSVPTPYPMRHTVTNLSTKTRKELVLDALRGGDWVNTATISDKAVGGSEGLRRLRELRAAGYLIEKRRHPDPDVDQFQYKLVEGTFHPDAPFVKDGQKVTAVDGEGRTVYSGTVATPLPWVSWTPQRAGSLIAKFHKCDLWVSPSIAGGWVWRAAAPDRLIDSGKADGTVEAKEAAIRAVIEAGL